MDRLFLDANVLFSAAWREDSGLLHLWKLRDAEILSSAYTVDEARRNLGYVEARARLDILLAETTIVAEGPAAALPSNLVLAGKDRPVLAAAIHAKATHLITGDRRDFGKLFERRLVGVLILRPADYLKSRQR
ncbi:MAG: putative toxin-antitoxin system toxin component, PIN family [Thermoanaerobaculia bacterium]